MSSRKVQILPPTSSFIIGLFRPGCQNCVPVQTSASPAIQSQMFILSQE